MKAQIALWMVMLAGELPPVALWAQTEVTPKLGGGQVAAEMVHIDVYYDAQANVLQARVDDSYGTPELRALNEGQIFASQTAQAVLNGKAYNAQYGWNAGGFFALPPGAAVWMESVAHSPELEVYEGWGRFAAYTPVFGTAGSPTRWKWSGAMVHNTYAVCQPAQERYFAEYHIFFGDATTGSRANFLQYDDTFVRLEWTATPMVEPLTFKFGAVAPTNQAPLVLLNAEGCTTNAGFALNLQATHGGAFACRWPLLVLPATSSHRGPAPRAPALGACLELQLESLSGPPGARLSVGDTNAETARFTLTTGEQQGRQRIPISAHDGSVDADPYGYVESCYLQVNQPGLYCLSFRVIDSSTNGAQGGPIHAPSKLYSVFLQAGLTVAFLERQGASVTAGFGGEPGKQFFLERRAGVGGDAPWQTVAGPLAGTNRLQRLTDISGGGACGFYRLRATGP